MGHHAPLKKSKIQNFVLISSGIVIVLFSISVNEIFGKSDPIFSICVFIFSPFQKGFSHRIRSCDQILQGLFCTGVLKVQLVGFLPQRNFGIGICIFLEFSLLLFRLAQCSKTGDFGGPAEGLLLANLLVIIKAESTYS